MSYEAVKVSNLNSYIEILIDRDITAPEDFREEISAIRSSKEGDIVHIVINTGGGSLDTASALLSAMRGTRAHIITEAVGTVASAGTLIFLAGNEFRVSQELSFMLHTASYGTGGKSNNVVEQVLHYEKGTRALVTSAYQNFLSLDEIEDLLSGGDFWMDAEEVVERLKARAELRLKLETEESGVNLNFERKDIEKWTKPRLVSFICDEDYQDAKWETKNPPIMVMDNDIDLSAEMLSEALANPSQYPAGLVIDKLKKLAKSNKIKVPSNIGLVKLYDKVKHLLE